MAIKRAFSTADSAISAIWGAVGLGRTPQSENIRVPFSPYSLVSVNITKELETVLSPFLGPITWIAALNTLAVGEFDPATIPSATQFLTSIAPKNLESLSIVSRACSSVIPFFDLKCTNCLINSGVFS